MVYRYNFYTFGHAVRELYSSRGSREGNNAFLEVRIFFDTESDIMQTKQYQQMYIFNPN